MEFLFKYSTWYLASERNERVRYRIEHEKSNSKSSNHYVLSFFYYINTSEIPGKLSRENFISSHVKRSPSLWLHNKSRLWKQADFVFLWCLYNKQNITYSLMDMSFIFSYSTRYLTRSLRSLMRYRVDHSKIKFISTSEHVISSISYKRFTNKKE